MLLIVVWLLLIVVWLLLIVVWLLLIVVWLFGCLVVWLFVGGGGGADLSADGKYLSMNHHARAINLGGRTPGSKLPASPPPLLRPNGGGQPWPCACAQSPTKTRAQHLSLNTTGMSTTRSKKRAATVGSRLSPNTAHELQDLYNPRRPPQGPSPPSWRNSVKNPSRSGLTECMYPQSNQAQR